MITTGYAAAPTTSSFSAANLPTAKSTRPAERIYLNPKLSSYFGVEYYNEGETTVIHCNALDRAETNWDEAHQAIIDRGGDLRLAGVGYGWWEIVG
jgi:hypothetical protein